MSRLPKCPECAHEWASAAGGEAAGEQLVVRDAFGNTLNEGDAITVIKDLKIKVMVPTRH